jgi:hypothetical protein
MQKCIAYSLIFLYGAAMLRPLSPFIEYAIQHDYIAKVLCINVDKPALQCNGACHLKKRIEATNTQNEEGQATLIQISDYPIGFAESDSGVPHNFVLPQEPHARYTGFFDRKPVDDIFHPPQARA